MPVTSGRSGRALSPSSHGTLLPESSPHWNSPFPEHRQQLWLTCAQGSTWPPVLWKGRPQRHSWLKMDRVATPMQKEVWRCHRSGSGDMEQSQGSKHIATATAQIVSPFPLGLLIEFQQNKCFKIPSVTEHTSLFLRYGNCSCPKPWDEMPVLVNPFSLRASEIKIHLLPYQSKTLKVFPSGSWPMWYSNSGDLADWPWKRTAQLAEGKLAKCGLFPQPCQVFQEYCNNGPSRLFFSTDSLCHLWKLIPSLCI